MKVWKNLPFTSTFKCRAPIISAPMAGVSGGLLAAEVTKAGGLGFIAAGHFQDVATLETQIKLYIEASGTPSDLAIGFIGFSSLATQSQWENYDYILRTYRPKAVQFFAPWIVKNGSGGRSNVELAHSYGSKVLAQVGTLKDAREAIRHGVDAIMCQGREAGGHGLRREVGNSTLSLASQAAQISSTPIVAAGGITKGQHIASALAVGCQAVSVGTRFWACEESIGDKSLQKELIKENSCDDVVRTTAFDQLNNELSTIKWPKPYDSSGVLRNTITDDWDERPSSDLQRAMNHSDLLEKYTAKRGQTATTAIYAGEGVGEVHSIDGAYDTLLRLEQETIEAIERLRSL